MNRFQATSPRLDVSAARPSAETGNSMLFPEVGPRGLMCVTVVIPWGSAVAVTKGPLAGGCGTRMRWGVFAGIACAAPEHDHRVFWSVVLCSWW